MVSTMKPLAKNMTIAIAGVGLIALLASPLVAAGNHGAEDTDSVQLAHMTQGYDTGWGGHMGMMGHGTMGSGMMGYGMMGYGTMGHAAVGNWNCPFAAGDAVDRDLSADDVRAHLEQSLKWHGNTRLKVGDVTETDDDIIIADIVTLDDSLVQRMEIDRHTGSMRSIQ